MIASTIVLGLQRFCRESPTPRSGVTPLFLGIFGPALRVNLEKKMILAIDKF